MALDSIYTLTGPCGDLAGLVDADRIAMVPGSGSGT